MASYYQRPLTSDEIYHHGIKGQKWGVRRYQNFDGTYTQKGLQRYNKSKDKFEKARADKKDAKANKNQAFNNLKNSNKLYKRDEKDAYTRSKNEYKTAKSNYKIAKKQMNSDYKQLKYDKQADQGKQLYKEGYRIMDTHPSEKMISAGSVIGTGGSVAANVLSNMGTISAKNSNYLTAGSIATGAVLAGVGSVIRISEASKDKKLRAYYGHY